MHGVVHHGRNIIILPVLQGAHVARGPLVTPKVIIVFDRGSGPRRGFFRDPTRSAFEIGGPLYRYHHPFSELVLYRSVPCSQERAKTKTVRRTLRILRFSCFFYRFTLIAGSLKKGCILCTWYQGCLHETAL